MIRGQAADLWRSLASRDLMTGDGGEGRMVERWRGLARRLDDGSEQQPDPLLEFVLDRLTPGMTVLDIGSAVGRWTVPIAQRARTVTAVEPVEGMRVVLGERLAAHGLTNVAVVGTPWMEAEVARHDVAVAAHSMYTSPDIVAFARKMQRNAAQTCYMALRIPAADGAIGELSERISGEWHDSPNFVLAYNALLEAGFTPNVFVEPQAVRHWTDATFDEALARARRHLHLADSRSDPILADTLRARLVPVTSGYRWPDCMRSALVWWESQGSATVG